MKRNRDGIVDLVGGDPRYVPAHRTTLARLIEVYGVPANNLDRSFPVDTLSRLKAEAEEAEQRLVDAEVEQSFEAARRAVGLEEPVFHFGRQEDSGGIRPPGTPVSAENLSRGPVRPWRP